jgi:hypothetical protein
VNLFILRMLIKTAVVPIRTVELHRWTFALAEGKIGIRKENQHIQPKASNKGEKRIKIYNKITELNPNTIHWMLMKKPSRERLTIAKVAKHPVLCWLGNVIEQQGWKQKEKRCTRQISHKWI